MSKRNFEEIKQIVAEVSDDEELKSLKQFLEEHTFKKKKLHTAIGKKKFFEKHGYCISAHRIAEFHENKDVIPKSIEVIVEMSSWNDHDFCEASLSNMFNNENVDHIWKYFKIGGLNFSDEIDDDDVVHYITDMHREDYRDRATMKAEYKLWLYFKRQPFPKFGNKVDVLFEKAIETGEFKDEKYLQLLVKETQNGEKEWLLVDEKKWKDSDYVDVSAFRDQIKLLQK